MSTNHRHLDVCGKEELELFDRYDSVTCTGSTARCVPNHSSVEAKQQGVYVLVEGDGGWGQERHTRTTRRDATHRVRTPRGREDNCYLSEFDRKIDHRRQQDSNLRLQRRTDF